MAFIEHMEHVDGENRGDITLFALSTCGWCQKTKGLLKDIGVEYEYIDVDHLKESDRKEALEQIKIHNPKCSFPTMVIDNNRCIIGFNEEKTREALGIGGKNYG